MISPLILTVLIWALWGGLAIFGPHRGPDDAAALAFAFALAIGATFTIWLAWLLWKLLRFLVG